jgi:hypothetical protein
MNQIDAAWFLRIGERTSRRYAAGKAVIPPAIEMLLNVMIKYRISQKSVLKLGLSPSARLHFYPARDTFMEEWRERLAQASRESRARAARHKK